MCGEGGGGGGGQQGGGSRESGMQRKLGQLDNSPHATGWGEGALMWWGAGGEESAQVGRSQRRWRGVHGRDEGVVGEESTWA